MAGKNFVAIIVTAAALGYSVRALSCECPMNPLPQDFFEAVAHQDRWLNGRISAHPENAADLERLRLVIVTGKVTRHDGPTMTFQIDYVHRGTVPGDSIVILGQDGGNCNESVTRFPVGTSWTLALSPDAKSLRRPNPFPDDLVMFGLNGCARYWLSSAPAGR